jgi:hypothetical protein
MHFIIRILKFGILRVPPIQVLDLNGEMKVLFGEFHRRTNLLALLSSNRGPETKLHTQNFEI